MAYIKKEQPAGQIYPQYDLQIAVQGADNTTTQATRTRKPPTLSSGDQILAVLHQIRKGTAILLQKQDDLLQGQDILLQQGTDLLQKADDLLQGQAILQQQTVAIGQSIGRIEIRVNTVVHGVDAVRQEVHGLRDDISRRYIFLIPFLHLK